MTNTMQLLIASIIIIILIVMYYWTTIMINIICVVSIKRGILSPNKLWWSISDLLSDPTGVELFYKVKKNYGAFYKTNILGNPTILVTDVTIAKTIFDNSPDVFAVGTLKWDFFKTFMPRNVGVLSGSDWRHMRSINESVLNTGRDHDLMDHFNSIITSNLSYSLPMNFAQFNDSAKSITSSIVFGVYKNDTIYNIFTDVNKIPIGQLNKSDSSRELIYDRLTNPQPNTLVSLLNIHDVPKGYLIDQVYHFVFPMVALITIHVPRIIALIIAHDHVKNKLLDTSVSPLPYLSNCIMEALRLNSPVISFFRKSTEPVFSFPSETDFLILANPILRDPAIFYSPDEFIPSRWTSTLMKSHYNIIFGLGPQRCPGRDLSLNILQKYISSYLIHMEHLKLVDESILFIKKPQIAYAINPYKIKFELVRSYSWST